MPKPFRFLMRVRYAECDSQGVVFNPRYGDYVDTAVTEFVRVLFGSYQSLVEQGYDYQVVRFTTDWSSPAVFDDVLAVSVETTRVGNTSFTYRLTFNEYFTDRLVATSEITYVMMKAPEYEKIPVPDFFREKIEQGAPGKVIDQAGIDSVSSSESPVSR